MGEIINLPSGAIAVLRRPEDVSERLQRPIRRAMGRVRKEVLLAAREVASQKFATDGERDAAAEKAMLEVGMTDVELDAFDAAQDATVVALVESWSYGGGDERARQVYAQPVTVESVQDLPGRDFRHLRNATAKLSNAMFLDASASRDPASPIVPSNGSSTASVEGLSTTPLSTGAPTNS